MDGLHLHSLCPRPARVVFLLQDLRFGGTQRQALELARHLDRNCFQVELWLLGAGYDLAPLAHSWEIPLIWLSRHPAVGPVSLKNLWLRLRSTPIDLLMLLTAVPNIWGRILGRLAKVPVIVGNCRGGAPHRQHERWLWPLAHHLLCNTRSLKAILTNHYRIPPSKVTVIPNGVDIDFFSPPVPGIRSSRPVILSVGRFVPEKDQATLISAFGRLTPRHPEAELWLVGEGPQKETLQRLAAQELPPNRVRWLPGDVDLRPLFQQAALFVLSSYWEGLPNVVLEAMAAGLSVVATAVGGLPELVVPGQTGWLVPSGDAPALATAITRLLTEPETRRAFGRAGRKRVEQNFSLPTMVRRYEAMFRHLIDHNPRQPQPRQPRSD